MESLHIVSPKQRVEIRWWFDDFQSKWIHDFRTNMNSTREAPATCQQWSIPLSYKLHTIDIILQDRQTRRVVRTAREEKRTGVWCTTLIGEAMKTRNVKVKRPSQTKKTKGNRRKWKWHWGSTGMLHNARNRITKSRKRQIRVMQAPKFWPAMPFKIFLPNPLSFFVISKWHQPHGTCLYDSRARSMAMRWAWQKWIGNPRIKQKMS